MQFKLALLSLLPAVLALPSPPTLLPRQSLNEITDTLLFSTTLPAFTARRNAKDPATLDWTSDGCTSSPDNPFGFPFVPACNRHDFGYTNYRAQTRFTVSAKAKIDDNFKADLYYQCAGVSAKTVCRALADVYYAAVRAFGGGDATPGRRDTSTEVVDWEEEYERVVEVYNAAVVEAQAKGELWSLE